MYPEDRDFTNKIGNSIAAISKDLCESDTGEYPSAPVIDRANLQDSVASSEISVELSTAGSAYFGHVKTRNRLGVRQFNLHCPLGASLQAVPLPEPSHGRLP
jgi:hypothetical protein